MAKHMRLPNGFGQISKLKQRLRNSYRAMVTIEWTDEGKPVRKIVGYYKTYNDAYTALVEYHKDPLAIGKKISMVELHDLWLEEYEKHNDNKNAKYNYSAAWKYGECLYRYDVRDVRSYHIKQAVEGEMPPSMHQRLHMLLNMMFDYAVQYDLTDKNYSRLANPIYDSTSDDGVKHFAFTEEEISTIWKHRDEYEVADMLLVQIYMGWRPQELVKLENINVDLDNWTITGGLKTPAGKERVVPIHDRIKPIVEKHWSDKGGTLFGKINSYYKYNVRFKVLVMGLGLNPEHEPHNGRVTFSTLCKKDKVDDYCRKKCMGHKIDDLTDRIYTDMGLDWFREEISKISI